MYTRNVAAAESKSCDLQGVWESSGEAVPPLAVMVTHCAVCVGTHTLQDPTPGV